MSTAIETQVIFANDFSIRVRANDNLQNRVVTEVNSGLLRIALAPGQYRRADILVTVALPMLRSLALNDATRAEIDGFADLEALNVVLNSASQLNITNSAVKTLDVHANAASELRAFGLSADTAEINTTGASRLELTVSERLSGRATQASVVRYRGNPTVDVEITDASSVQPD